MRISPTSLSVVAVLAQAAVLALLIADGAHAVMIGLAALILSIVTVVVLSRSLTRNLERRTEQ